MQIFKMQFYADAKGLACYDLCLKALHHPLCAAMYDYKIEYNLDCPEHYSGKMHVITWWRKKDGVQR